MRMLPKWFWQTPGGRNHSRVLSAGDDPYRRFHLFQTNAAALLLSEGARALGVGRGSALWGRTFQAPIPVERKSNKQQNHVPIMCPVQITTGREHEGK